jgi:hypothetical protein
MNDKPKDRTQLVMNVLTGQKVLIDPDQSKMSRMKRRIVTWANTVDTFYDDTKHRLVMVTLTYKPEIQWEKNHIRDFMKYVRRKLKKNILAYAWVAENHLSGRIHYHLYYVVFKKTDVPMPDKSGMWPYGSSKIETGKSPFYLVAYLKKEYQKDFSKRPKGMRTFGIWIDKNRLSKDAYYQFRLSAFPGWLQKQLENSEDLIYLFPSRREGGGWEVEIPEDRLHGNSPKKAFFLSPWILYNIKNASQLNKANLHHRYNMYFPKGNEVNHGG